LLIADIMMPRMDGFELVQNLRRRGVEIPVLMLRARVYADERIELGGVALDSSTYTVSKGVLMGLLSYATFRATNRDTSKLLAAIDRVADGDFIADLSSNALVMTKLDSQQYILDKAPYSLDEQIKRCVILLSPQWTKKRIDLTADLESATYLGNKDLMQHVWINIVANAIKFTPEEGKIWLALKKDGRGMFMTEEELGHAFEKYYQGFPRQASRGLGLGLAIAKRIVVLAGGRIEASSVSGEGSTLRVSLPTQ
jgi:signal transduction histidine kinase